MQDLKVDMKTKEDWMSLQRMKEYKAITSSFLESPMREQLVKFYQHFIKSSHVSPGFHHHCFWVSTSFSGWAGVQ